MLTILQPNTSKLVPMHKVSICYSCSRRSAVLSCRRNEEIDSLERTAPSGGVWGSQLQPPWWKVLPLTMVGSVSDPQVNDLITTVNDSAFWAGKEEPHGVDLAAQAEHAAVLNVSVKTSGFQFAGLTKPSGLRKQWVTRGSESASTQASSAW